jgi:chromosome segregation ATPase
MLFALSFTLCAAVAAERAHVDVSPVEKVLELMRDLKTQVETEGAAESETYNKFACFCKDTQLGKMASIKSHEDDDTSFSATIEQKTAEQNSLTASLADLNHAVDSNDATLKALTDARAKANAEYLVEHKDVADSVTGVTTAIADIKAATSFAQVQAVAKRAKVAALLQGKNIDDPSGTGGLMDILDELAADWTKKLKRIEDEETAKVQAFEDAKAAQKQLIADAKAAIDTKTQQLVDCQAAIADYKGRLTETTALMHDDKVYLKDLTSQCEHKAAEWDQRSSQRAGELGALTKAIEIISGDVEGAAADSGAGGRTGVAPVALVQGFAQARQMDARKIDDKYYDVVFLQRQEVVVSQKEAAQRLDAITQIKKSADLLKSPELSLLAMKMAADPFAKVKTLIQQLIERLMTESANEATHKGWCDTEIGKANTERDHRHSDTKKLSAETEVLEAKKADLESEIAKLNTERSDLQDAHTEAQRIRGAEKAENKQTLETAQEGLKALNSAIDVLQSFYSKASRATVLLQAPVTSSPVAADMVGSEYEGGAYKGNQAAAGGIMGMLETIKSDFERTIKETSSAEQAASADFAKFDTETKASISSMETGIKNAESDLKMTSGDLVAALNDLKENQLLLDKSLEALEKLRPACVDTSMSWEEKVAAQKAEIEALKNALAVFNEEDGLGFLQK